MADLFELAARAKLRFRTGKGDLTAEDLFDLPMTSDKGVSLSGIWSDLNKQIKEQEETNPLIFKRISTKALETKFAIVNSVIQTRLEMAERKKNEIGKKERNQQILNLIADKKNDERRALSIEELEGLIEE